MHGGINTVHIMRENASSFGYVHPLSLFLTQTNQSVSVQQVSEAKLSSCYASEQGPAFVDVDVRTANVSDLLELFGLKHTRWALSI